MMNPPGFFNPKPANRHLLRRGNALNLSNVVFMALVSVSTSVVVLVVMVVVAVL